MKRWIYFLLAILIFALVHEGLHAMAAMPFGEYQAFHIRPFGLEVTFQTPVAERSGIQWALISGVSNITTLLIGYVLLILGNQLSRAQSVSVKAVFYYTTFLFLLLDAFNLSIGPFLYGGDANGIAVGLGINRWIIQAGFFLVLLVNRELAAQKLLPLYNVKTDNLLLKPWFVKKA